jgi:hypothetical protein
MLTNQFLYLVTSKLWQPNILKKLSENRVKKELGEINFRRAFRLYFNTFHNNLCPPSNNDEGEQEGSIQQEEEEEIQQEEPDTERHWVSRTLMTRWRTEKT